MQLNPSRPFMGVFALFVFAYAIYVVIASDPLTRINRICTPVVSWPERVVVAGVRVFSPENAPSFQQSFDHGFNTCRRWTWGVLYRPEYERMKAEKAARDARAKATQSAGAGP